MAHITDGIKPDCVTWGMAFADLLDYQVGQGSASAGAALIVGELAGRAIEAAAREAEPFVLAARGVVKAAQILTGRTSS